MVKSLVPLSRATTCTSLLPRQPCPPEVPVIIESRRSLSEIDRVQQSKAALLELQRARGRVQKQLLKVKRSLLEFDKTQQNKFVDAEN